MAKISDFLTEQQIETCSMFWIGVRNGKISQSQFIDLVTESITKPSIEIIDQKLGQKNDPRFLAYAIEWAYLNASREVA